METNVLQILIQGGAIGIALVAIFLNYKSNNGKFSTLMNVVGKNAESNQKLASAIESLERTVQSKF